MRWILPLLLVAPAAFARDEQTAPGGWPLVRPIEVRKRIESGNARVRVAILSALSGMELYELRCNELDARDAKDDGGAEYYGMFQCRLWQAREGDLLRSGAAWEDDYTTRGVFDFEQVVGPCRKDAGFGLSRTFFVRGMKLVLTISSFESPPIAESLAAAKTHFDFRFDFDVSVAPRCARLEAAGRRLEATLLRRHLRARRQGTRRVRDRNALKQPILSV
jgi:hypothetical protein